MAAAASNRPDPISTLETAYTPGLDDQAWLDEVAASIRPLLDRGSGTLSALGDGTHAIPGPPDITALTLLGASDAALEVNGALHEYLARHEVRQLMDAAGPVRLLNKVLRDPQVVSIMATHGISDIAYLLVGDLATRYVFIGAPWVGNVRLSASRQRMLTRLAAHVSAALRLRVAPSAPTSLPLDGHAVLSPGGVLHDALPAAATPASRDALREAVKLADRARGPLRREDPDAALEAWRALVSGRWSLVDHFDTDGRRFVIARPNPVAAPEVEVLTPREAEIAWLAAQGHSNKLIAYELGRAVSTVANLLARAMQKLGVRSRPELVQRLSPFRWRLPDAETPRP